MRSSWIAFLLLLPVTAFAQQPIASPHGELEMACEVCHTAEGWSPVRLDQFDHDSAGFELVDAHTGLECGDCHVDLEFGAASPECAACHADVHLGELGRDCSRCHTMRTFIDTARQRDLHRESTFPLTGAHAGTDCESCHIPRDLGDLQYLATETDCIGCHRSEYESVVDPDHVQDGFAEECEYCHSTSTWLDGFFNHELQLAGMPVICVDCHQDDYDQTTRPNHTTAGFPTDCEACHNTRSWYGSYFQHDQEYFPIFSGRHAGEWSECNECHSSPTDYTVYTCLSCHPHSDRPKTDEQHSEEDGYSYDSIECLRCHPDGRSE